VSATREAEHIDRGARKLLVDMIEADVAKWIDAHATVRNAAGRRQVVRNGLPKRNITTGLGPLSPLLLDVYLHHAATVAKVRRGLIYTVLALRARRSRLSAIAKLHPRFPQTARRRQLARRLLFFAQR
jgi:hypothetical protein